MKLNDKVLFYITSKELVPGTIAFDHKDTFLVAFKEEDIPTSFFISTHYPNAFDSWTAQPEGFTEMFGNFPNCKFKWVHKNSFWLCPYYLPLEELLIDLEKEIL